MKRLYTKKESLRDYNEILLFLWMIYVIIAVIWGILKEPVWMEIGVTSILFIIAEIITFLRWYPAEVAHKRGIAFGKVYEGKLRIQTKYEKKLGQRYPRWSYSLIIICDVDGKLMTWEEECWDNPAEYIPGSRSCKVYFYKNKYYLQYFYHQSEKVLEGVYSEYSIQDMESLDGKELQKAGMERMSNSGMHTKTEIIVPPVYFMYLKQPPLKTMFVEVRVKSEKIYDEIAFLLNERIADYVHSIELDESTNDDVLKEGTEKLVKDIIFRDYEKIFVDEVFVVIR